LQRRENLTGKRSRKPKGFFELYEDGKLVGCGSMKRALKEFQKSLQEHPLLEVHRIGFQVSVQKPHDYRLLLDVTLFGEIEGQVEYHMTTSEMFELVQSTVKSLPNKKRVLLENFR
jgi:hypothetical protein